jgi:putative ABC transport system permease protein
VHRDVIKFVGIMAPTGTPHDRAIYIPLKAFYLLDGHDGRMADDENYREISGAYLKIKRIRGGVLHPGLQTLKYDIDQSSTAQLVIPGDVLPRLFNIIGWVDRVLVVIAVLVTLLAALFLVVALLSALRERRRDIALLRALGAQRSTVFGLIICEALAIALLGGVAGLLAGHGMTAIGCQYIQAETGLRFSAHFISLADVWVLPGMALLGALSGLAPAIQAYRLGVLRNLEPIS